MYIDDKIISEGIEQIDDWDLVTACRAGNEHLFEILVRRHYELIVNIGYRFFGDMSQAYDTAQEVFVKVYGRLDSITPGSQPFVHLLCRITTNMCRSKYRKRRSESETVSKGKVNFWYEHDRAGEVEGFDDETAQAIRLVNDALGRIKPDERMVLILAHVSELKTSEIASIVNKPDYTVRRMIRRAKEKVRKLIARSSLEDYA